jgi:hypothetical protein
MPLQFSAAVRNARVGTIETTIGTSAIMRWRTGAPPVNVAAADTGTVLATLNLPADYLTAPAAGVVSLSGSWTDPTADAGGVCGHFRIYASDGTTCHAQGTVTATGGGGDMTLLTTTIVAGQPVTVTGFTLTDGNA